MSDEVEKQMLIVGCLVLYIADKGCTMVNAPREGGNYAKTQRR